jgi:hypothetical protein
MIGSASALAWEVDNERGRVSDQELGLEWDEEKKVRENKQEQG